MADEKIVVTNIMEEIIEAKLDSFLGATDICKCDLCRADVKALALNRLPPKYVASSSGNVFTHMQTNTLQMVAEMTVALTTAAEMVIHRPRHGPEDRV